MTDIKTVYITSLSKNKEKGSRTDASTEAPLPPQKKIITTTKKWSNITIDDLHPDRQFELLLLARDFSAGSASHAQQPQHYTLIIEHIKQKLSGYKNQDQIKNKYDPESFVDVSRVFDLLISCNMECHYCKKRVMLLYEYVREPLQWSLDRIDNSLGHTRNNLFIACLTCNLRRRCIKPERYELTKKCSSLKRISYVSSPDTEEQSWEMW